MALKVKNTAIVRDNSEIGTGIHSMWLEDQEIAGSARPGQFVWTGLGSCGDSSVANPTICVYPIRRSSNT